MDTIHFNTFDPPIIARYIRLHPVEWYGWISLRMELYGCRSGRKKLVESLGKENDHAGKENATLNYVQEPQTI